MNGLRIINILVIFLLGSIGLLIFLFHPWIDMTGELIMLILSTFVFGIMFLAVLIYSNYPTKFENETDKREKEG